MAQEHLPFRAFRTGRVDRPQDVRHSLAFDLTSLDFRGRTVISAALHLSGRHTGQIAAIQLSDPGGEAAYGQASSRPWPDITRIELSAEGLADLQEAGGCFFSIDAVVSRSPESGAVPEEALESANLVIVAEPAAALAAAA